MVRAPGRKMSLKVQPENYICTTQTAAQMNPGMVGPTLSPYIRHIFKASVCQELLGWPPSMGETSKQIVP